MPFVNTCLKNFENFIKNGGGTGGCVEMSAPGGYITGNYGGSLGQGQYIEVFGKRRARHRRRGADPPAGDRTRCRIRFLSGRRPHRGRAGYPRDRRHVRGRAGRRTPFGGLSGRETRRGADSDHPVHRDPHRRVRRGRDHRQPQSSPVERAQIHRQPRHFPRPRRGFRTFRPLQPGEPAVPRGEGFP